MLIIKKTDPQVINFFLRYIKKNIPIGVGIVFKEYNYESLNTVLKKK